RDELSDGPLTGADAVEPRLRREDDVVLPGVVPTKHTSARTNVELFAPALAGDRADFADADLERVWLPMRRREVQPHRLALVHRQHHAATLAPLARHPRRVVVDAPERERSEPGRQWIAAAVVGDAEGALDADGDVADAQRVVGESEG